MRGVLTHVTDEELAFRRTRGLDRWDEMWEGVLHMPPAPRVEHQRILDELISFLVPLLRRDGRGRLFSGINVFRADDDYRIPDVTFVAAANEAIVQEDGTRGGGPDAVIEIRSPHDESYDKFPFFARLGVREVIVIERDTKRVELFRLAGSQYVAVQPDAEGGLVADTLRVRFARRDTTPPRLLVSDAILANERTEI